MTSHMALETPSELHVSHVFILEIFLFSQKNCPFDTHWNDQRLCAETFHFDQGSPYYQVSLYLCPVYPFDNHSYACYNWPYFECGPSMAHK